LIVIGTVPLDDPPLDEPMPPLELVEPPPLLLLVLLLLELPPPEEEEEEEEEPSPPPPPPTEATEPPHATALATRGRRTDKGRRVRRMASREALGVPPRAQRKNAIVTRCPRMCAVPRGTDPVRRNV
jgi:hypothetical protein